jgi:hypothetical protein
MNYLEIPTRYDQMTAAIRQINTNIGNYRVAYKH